jgi:hypothetical protein
MEAAIMKISMKQGLALGLLAQVQIHMPASIEYERLRHLGICTIHMKQKISVINETKQDEILLKPKV